MGEFASNGKANAGLTTGIIGTTLGGLWALGAGNGNGGILGGLLGGNNCQMSPVSALQSEVAMLRAEKYSDKNTADVYSAVRGEYKDLLEKWITPLSDEACRNRERIAVLETQVKCENEKALLREQIVREQLNRRIDQCCCETNGRINQLNQSVYQMSQTLGSITTTVIPRTAICPEVMPRYNSFVTPTDNAPATQPIVGTVDVS
jgi:hypothetical protein